MNFCEAQSLFQWDKFEVIHDFLENISVVFECTVGLAGAIQFVENTIESGKRENWREIAIRPLFTGGANM
jgi:hypothetical protein